MPELPEVTTIVNDINKHLVGSIINEAKITSLGENLRIKSKQDLDQLLAGKTIEKASRKAKYLLLELSNGNTLVIHLKLTGQLILRDRNFLQEEFNRLILKLSNGKQLRFNDRNGAAEVFIVENIDDLNQALAKDAFEINGEEFFKNLSQSEKKTIKETLVDQKIIAGVGNIYADEALFVAKINPFTSPKAISEKDTEELLKFVQQVLNEGIKHRGTTIDSYRDLLGNPGSHQNYLRVYGKTGQPCQVCQTPIEYTEISGRRTHFCPSCQPDQQLSLF